MTEVTADTTAAVGGPKARSLYQVNERTRRRHASERRFKMMGLAAVIFSIIALLGLMTSILSNGLSSFRQTYITMEVFLDAGYCINVCFVNKVFGTRYLANIVSSVRRTSSVGVGVEQI